MRLVRLDCNCYVNPEDVQELAVNTSAQSIVVRMRNGIGHYVPPDYGKGIYDTLDRLKKELEGPPS